MGEQEAGVGNGGASRGLGGTCTTPGRGAGLRRAPPRTAAAQPLAPPQQRSGKRARCRRRGNGQGEGAHRLAELEHSRRPLRAARRGAERGKRRQRADGGDADRVALEHGRAARVRLQQHRLVERPQLRQHRLPLLRQLFCFVLFLLVVWSILAVKDFGSDGFWGKGGACGAAGGGGERGGAAEAGAQRRRGGSGWRLWPRGMRA